MSSPNNKLKTIRANFALILLVLIAVALQFGLAIASDDPPPFFEPIGNITPKRMVLGHPLIFGVAGDSGSTAPIIASGLPTGATFTDHSNGTGTFEWTPRGGQEGITRVTFSTAPSLRNPMGGQDLPIQVSGWPLSHGIYRIGYEDGQAMVCTQDHLTHTPPLKLDLVSSGFGPNAMHKIWASADGRIREIIDANQNCCNSDGCSACNNYVRLEHTNGEWTKYTHFRTNTVTDPDTANLSIGMCVSSGTFLGYEGDVGHTSGSGSQNRVQQDCSGVEADTTKKCGIHLHFEVRMNGPNSKLRLPLFCEVPGFYMVKNQAYTAGTCGANQCSSYVAIDTTVYSADDIKVIQTADSIRADTVSVEGTASVAYFAGKKILLKPGFVAKTNAYFHAMINECDGAPEGCPSP